MKTQSKKGKSLTLGTDFKSHAGLHYLHIDIEHAIVEGCSDAILLGVLWQSKRPGANREYE
eukprot:scaffold199054_cov28-Tisochrysis_lutea.AAC.1